MNRTDATPGLLFRLAVAALALVALGVSVFLTVVVLGSDPAGCGDGSSAFDCDRVLSSRWSKWLGVPVSAPAAGLYATAVLAVVLLGPRCSASLRRIAWSLLLALALTAAGAALWFVALQLLVVKELCPYCMTVHGCGLIFAGLVTWRFFTLPRGEDLGRPSSTPAILMATAVLATLVVGQLTVRPSSSADVVHYPDIQPATPQATAKTAGSDRGLKGGPTEGLKPRQTKLLALLGGKTFIDLNEHMILGSPDAEIVAVKLFDYTCLHCRTMHRHLETAREHYGDRLAIVLAPVPLNPGCNRLMRLENPHHVYACFYARLARAVWLQKPERFEEFHAWLMAGKEAPQPAKTRKFAAEILGPERTGAALLDREISLHIGKCVDLWSATSQPGQSNRLPQLLFATSLIPGEKATAEELIEHIEKIVLEKARRQEEANSGGDSP